jgi:hypothetical protein
LASITKDSFAYCFKISCNWNYTAWVLLWLGLLCSKICPYFYMC